MAKTLSAGAKQALVMLVLSGSILSCFFIVSVAANQLTLLRPRWNVPTLTLANETIEIDAQTNFPITSVNDFNATLKSSFGNFPLIIQSVTQNVNTIHAVASFPSNVMRDVLYDLDISVGGMHDEQRHAVKVLTAYKSEFTIIVWCDTHIGYAPDSSQIWTRTYDVFRALVDAANLVNPEFIILCGDITQTGLNSEYQFVYDQCMRLNVPIFIGPGNHDCLDTSEFQRWFQFTNFSFDYGPNYHFDYIDTGIIFDALRDQYFNWLASDLAAHSSSAVKIVGGHAPPYAGDPGTDKDAFSLNFEHLQQQFVNLLETDNVTAYIYGHIHHDKISYGNCTAIPAGSTTNKTWFIETGSGLQDSAFRVMHFKNKHMFNVTSLVNASTGQRSQDASFIALPEWYDWNNPPPVNIPYLEADVNVSKANDLDATPVHTIECNVTNRYSQESFTNMTVLLNILSSKAPTITSNGSISVLWEKQRTDVPQALTIELQFFLGPHSGIQINATGD